jgi:hypothetical protein
MAASSKRAFEEQTSVRGGRCCDRTEGREEEEERGFNQPVARGCPAAESEQLCTFNQDGKGEQLPAGGKHMRTFLTPSLG